MADDDTQRPSLEAPKLFGRRRATPADAAPAEPAFEDSGTDEPTAVLPVVEGPTNRKRRVRTTPTTVAATADTTAGDVDLADEETTAVPRRPRRAPRDRSTPPLAGLPAAAVSGALTGLSLVVFVWLGSRGCEVTRGTTSCGTAPGLIALTVIVVLAVVVGRYLLRYFHIPDPGSTSFLGTGMACIAYLVVPPLLDHVDHWSMVLIVPALTAVTFLGAWKVSTTYVTES